LLAKYFHMNVFTVAASVVPDDINAVPPAACGFSGDSLHVDGAVPYVPSAATPKPHPDLHSGCVPPRVSQHRFQNGVWQHVMVMAVTAVCVNVTFSYRCLSNAEEPHI
jgi:hypothetical protein